MLEEPRDKYDELNIQKLKLHFSPKPSLTFVKEQLKKMLLVLQVINPVVPFSRIIVLFVISWFVVNISAEV